MQLDFAKWVSEEHKFHEADGFWSSFMRGFRGEEEEHKKPPMTQKEALTKAARYLEGLAAKLQGDKTTYDPEIKSHLPEALREVVLSIFWKEDGYIQSEALDILAHYVFGTRLYGKQMPTEVKIGKVPDLDELSSRVPDHIFVDESNASNITSRAYNMRIYMPWHILERLRDILKLNIPDNYEMLISQSKEWAITYFPSIVKSNLIAHQREIQRKQFEQDPLGYRSQKPEPETEAEQWFLNNFHVFKDDMHRYAKGAEKALAAEKFNPFNMQLTHARLKDKMENTVRRADVSPEAREKLVQFLNLKYFGKAKSNPARPDPIDVILLSL
jgi:hypothetical protein